MNLFKFDFSEIFSEVNTDKPYLELLFFTFIAVLIIVLFKKGIERFYFNFDKDIKIRYKHNRNAQLLLNIITVVALFIIWGDYIGNLVTLLSFTSAAATIALREIIFNFFAGIYIRVKKPFAVEDRIEIDDIKGDVVNINTLNFEVLEIGDRIHGEQSSGIIVSVPNSYALTHTIKNYVKEFKYIWNEIVVKLPLDIDLDKTKEELYLILSKNEILKTIPKKMKREISNINLSYRIYFSNLEPYIYTKVVDDHIELYVRYLVNPKKTRTIEDSIWNQIIIANKEGKISLFIKET